MALTFEEVMVQKAPGAPVYSEHSLVTRRSPLRGADAVSAEIWFPVADALGPVSPPGPSAHADATSAAAHIPPAAAHFAKRLVSLILSSCSVTREPRPHVL